MEMSRIVDRNAVSVAEAHLARVAGEGSSTHPYLAALVRASGRHAARDLADAVHLLCGLHGRHPGMIEVALRHAPDGQVGEWLALANDSFERERHYLVALTAAVGPLPGTPGAAETEASLMTQRNALDILAGSERRGCAIGATAALVGDWPAIRAMLDCAAARAGLTPPPPSLPDEAAVVAAVGQASDTPASARALMFGAEQLLLQHRGLFDLLEARAEARGDY